MTRPMTALWMGTPLRSLLITTLILVSVSLCVAGGKSAGNVFSHLPLGFELNQGQAPAGVRYLTRGPGYLMSLDDRGVRLRLGESEVRMEVVGGNAGRAMAEEQLPGRVNYLIESDPRTWRTNIATFARVRYRDVYPGIDLVYYGNQRQLEYDFVVAPGTNPNVIRLRMGGTQKLELQPGGDLLVRAGTRELRWRKPVVYQEIDGKKRPVTGEYKLISQNEIGFALGEYNPTATLVIDPTLAYSTYLGGSTEGFEGRQAGNIGSSIAVDSSGNAYIAGMTDASDFPTTPGSLQPVFPPCKSHTECVSYFVTKLNSSGSALVYSTYFGKAPTHNDVNIAVSSSGRAYISGWVRDRGEVPTTSNGFQRSRACSSCSYGFLSVLNSSGSALVYSTYLGPVYEALGLAVGTSGVAYITGTTNSDSFPVTPNAYQATRKSAEFVRDAFISKIDPSKSRAASLQYSSYLGGSGEEDARAVATSGGRVYLTGNTESADFPTTAGAMRRTLLGGNDVFVVKIDTNLAGAASLVYSTYLGGSGGELGEAIATLNGHAFVAGHTSSTNFPVTSGATQKTHAGGGSDGFAARLNSSGAALVYGTYLGGSRSDLAQALAVSSAGQAFIAGVTESSNFPTTADGFDRDFFEENCSDIGVAFCDDAFFMKLSGTGGRVYSTFLGGQSDDNANAVAVDTLGSAYVTGSTVSPDFPTTSGAYQRSQRGGTDAFITKFAFDSDSCSVSSNPQVKICSPKNEATVKSPVRIVAVTNSGHPNRLLQLYVNGKKRHEIRAQRLDHSVTLSSGRHRLTVQAVENGAVVAKQTINITVSP